MLSKKKPRQPRVERTEESELHDETEHLWAVSYADFLMVLLSFFILFFSVDKDDKFEVIRKIASATGGESATSEPSNGLKGSGGGDSEISLSTLEQHLKDFKYSVDERDQKLVLDFEEGLYDPGDYYLKGGDSKKLRNLLQVLLPYRSSIEVTLIGYADSVPIDPWKREVIKSNFDLSAIRASKAASIAENFGFSSNQIKTKGVISDSSNSRSLSLEVRPLRGNSERNPAATVLDEKELGLFYCIQIYASREESDAHEFATRISFLPGVRVHTRPGKNGEWHYVTVGKSEDLSEMLRYRERLMKATGRLDIFVRPLLKRSPASGRSHSTSKYLLRYNKVR